MGETIVNKHIWEQWSRNECGVRIQEYHGDNGIFATAAYKDDYRLCGQTFKFSGVGAHHQNGGAERSIRTVVEMARSMMLHMAIHWPDEYRKDLWLFALEHATYVWNNVPSGTTGLSPVGIFSGIKFASHGHLLCLHVFGCPCYVLQPTLQDGKKLPKWLPRARCGQFLGLSPTHSTNTGMIKNLTTGKITAQFHVVYDDWFLSIPNFNHPDGGDEFLNLQDLIHLSRGTREFYLDEEFDERGAPIPALVLAGEWMT